MTNIIDFPVKIITKDKIEEYSSKLISGEIQLLITMNCNLYLTDGKGGYIEFKTINSGITLLEVQKLIDSLDEELSKRIDDTDSNVDTLTNTINQLISDINLKFEEYATKEDVKKEIINKLNYSDISNNISIKSMPYFGV